MKKIEIATTVAVLFIFMIDLASASQVVALGASNTSGRGQGRHTDGVPQFEAYPAQLQNLLRKQGCRTSVSNAGVPGDTTDGMLERLPQVVGRDTRVLILQPGGNDERQGSANMTDAIVQAASARKIRVIMLDNLGDIAGPYRMPDGQHFSVEGHAAIAAHLAPQVRSALGC